MTETREHTYHARGREESMLLKWQFSKTDLQTASQSPAQPAPGAGGREDTADRPTGPLPWTRPRPALPVRSRDDAPRAGPRPRGPGPRGHGSRPGCLALAELRPAAAAIGPVTQTRRPSNEETSLHDTRAGTTERPQRINKKNLKQRLTPQTAAQDGPETQT